MNKRLFDQLLQDHVALEDALALLAEAIKEAGEESQADLFAGLSVSLIQKDINQSLLTRYQEIGALLFQFTGSLDPRVWKAMGGTF